MMKRTTNEAGSVQWRKIGGGSFYFRNRIIKPNQVFTAKLEDIPEGFRDVIVQVETGKKANVIKPEAAPPAVPLEYEIRSRGAGYYNVEDADGKVLNEKALRKDAAEALIKSLQE